MSENMQDQPQPSLSSDFWSPSETCEGEGWDSVLSDAGHRYRVRKCKSGYQVLDELGKKFISCGPKPLRPNVWDERLGVSIDPSQPGDQCAWDSPSNSPQRVRAFARISALADVPFILYNLGHNLKIFPLRWWINQHHSDGVMFLHMLFTVRQSQVPWIELLIHLLILNVPGVQIEMQFRENRHEQQQEGKRWTEWIDAKEWLTKWEATGLGGK
jgi:hypothetical protein